MRDTRRDLTMHYCPKSQLIKRIWLKSKCASAVPEGQAEELNPRVSVDQTGISECSAIVNPVVSVDQSGAEKRTLVPNIDSEMPAKRPRMCLAPEPDGLENANNDSIDDELISPNSRWEASEELTEFLGTSAKRLSRFECRSLVKFYPRPNVDSVYTPALDEYLKPFIQGVSAPDKPLKELQDNILDIFGPLSTAYENLIAMLHTIGSDAFIQLDKESISAFLTCVKHTMFLVGDVSSRVATNRRELVLKKINPLLLSLANEDFTDTNKQLFGPGFEQRLKARSETADTIGKAAKVVNPFFEGWPPVHSHAHVEADHGQRSSRSARLLLDQICSAGEEETEAEARSHDFKTHIFTTHKHSDSTNSKAFQTKQFATRYVYKFSSSFRQADRLSSNGTPKVFYFNMGKNYSGPLGFTSGTGISNRVYEASCSASSSQDAITDSNFGNSVGSEGARVIEQGGSSPGKTTSCDRGLHKFAVCSAKKGWRESPCSESEAIKSIHNIRTFQNGRYSYVKRPSKTRGLVSKNRPQVCLFNSTHLDKSSEIPSFSVERQHARVCLSPLRFSFCPESVHEADETSCSSIETAGHSANNLFRRHINYSRILRNVANNC